jgi:hypothetical protein
LQLACFHSVPGTDITPLLTVQQPARDLFDPPSPVSRALLAVEQEAVPVAVLAEVDLEVSLVAAVDSALASPVQSRASLVLQ